MTRAGFWEVAPEALGVWSQGFAVRAAATGAAVTVETHCGQTHSIYLGTRIDVDCGKVSATLDGGTAVTVDCYAPAAYAQSRVRRLLFAGVAAGAHVVVVTITGTKNAASAGYYCYFDFLECAVLSDVPDAPAMRTDVAVATDFDTQHTYNLSPQRVVWAVRKLGLVGVVDHYAGVFYWGQRVAVGGVIPEVLIAISGTADAFVDISGSTVGCSNFPADTAESMSLRMAGNINETLVGVWADTDGAGTLRIYCRSANYSFTVTPSGGATVSSGSLSGGTAPVWTVDPGASPTLNRAFSDWNADFFEELVGAEMACVCSFSQELVQAPDDPGGGAVWYQRFHDGTVAQTATGVGGLWSSQCAFGAAVQAYLATAYNAVATLMEAAGLTAWLQFGEVGWWFNAGGSPASMAYYDADTAAAATAALGRALYVFTGPGDDPGVNGGADAAWLAGRLAGYVAAVRAVVAAAHAGAKFELLWPLDVNLPETRRLNWAVNLPAAWKAKAGSGLDSFLCEGFQFGGTDRDLNQVARCAGYPFVELGWDRASCGYLMGIFNAGWPWVRDYLTAAGARVAVKVWAWDHICMYGRMVPVPASARRAAEVQQAMSQ